MNAEMIYANNKVMVVNEKGEYIDRVDYYDNLREVLHLKNQLEQLEVNIKKDKEKYNKYSKSSKKKIINSVLLTQSCIILGIPAVFYCLSGFDKEIMQNIVNYKIDSIFGPINYLQSFYLMSETTVGIPITIVTALQDYFNNLKIDESVKTIEPKLREEEKQQLEILKRIMELEKNKTTNNNNYNDFDIIDIETNEINKPKIKSLQREV